MAVFLEIEKNSRSRNTTAEAAQSRFDSFVFTHDNLGHTKSFSVILTSCLARSASLEIARVTAAERLSAATPRAFVLTGLRFVNTKAAVHPLRSI